MSNYELFTTGGCKDKHLIFMTTDLFNEIYDRNIKINLKYYEEALQIASEMYKKIKIENQYAKGAHHGIYALRYVKYFDDIFTEEAGLNYIAIITSLQSDLLEDPHVIDFGIPAPPENEPFGDDKDIVFEDIEELIAKFYEAKDSYGFENYNEDYYDLIGAIYDESRISPIDMDNLCYTFRSTEVLLLFALNAAIFATAFTCKSQDPSKIENTLKKFRNKAFELFKSASLLFEI